MHGQVGNLSDKEASDAIDGTISSGHCEPEPVDAKEMMQPKREVIQLVVYAGGQIVEAVGEREETDAGLRESVWETKLTNSYSKVANGRNWVQAKQKEIAP